MVYWQINFDEAKQQLPRASTTNQGKAAVGNNLETEPLLKIRLEL